MYITVLTLYHEFASFLDKMCCMPIRLHVMVYYMWVLNVAPGVSESVCTEMTATSCSYHLVQIMTPVKCHRCPLEDREGMVEKKKKGKKGEE